MSGVFQNIDPPPLSQPSECVLPPHQRRGSTHSPAVRGWGVNILEDARHWIGLLQYNLSTPRPLCGADEKPEPVFVNLSGSPGIDSQPG
jgi:hypothetical protein